MEEKTTPPNLHHAGFSVWKRLLSVAEETSGSGSCVALRGCENLSILMLSEYNEVLLFLSSTGRFGPGARKPIPLWAAAAYRNQDVQAIYRQGLDARRSFSSRSDTAVPAVL